MQRAQRALVAGDAAFFFEPIELGEVEEDRVRGEAIDGGVLALGLAGEHLLDVRADIQLDLRDGSLETGSLQEGREGRSTAPGAQFADVIEQGDLHSGG